MMENITTRILKNDIENLSVDDQILNSLKRLRSIINKRNGISKCVPASKDDTASNELGIHAIVVDKLTNKIVIKIEATDEQLEQQFVNQKNASTVLGPATLQNIVQSVSNEPYEKIFRAQSIIQENLCEEDQTIGRKTANVNNNEKLVISEKEKIIKVESTDDDKIDNYNGLENIIINDEEDDTEDVAFVSQIENMLIDEIELLDDVDPDLRCYTCDKYFNSENLLLKHMRMHTELPICEICGMKFKKFDDMLKHQNGHKINKKKTVPWKYRCSECFDEFPTQTELKKHLKNTHRLLKNNVCVYLCRYCDKELATNFSRKMHERIHTGLKTFMCEYCGTNFRLRATLVQHLPMHTGEKRYKCLTCEKSFSRKSHLQIHSVVHTGEKPYSCDICDKRYTQLGDMRRHKKHHASNNCL